MESSINCFTGADGSTTLSRDARRVGAKRVGGVSLVGSTGGAGVDAKLDGNAGGLGVVTKRVGAELRSCTD